MSVRELLDLPYVSGGHERQRLDLYLPASDNPTPLIVYIHGGAFMYGSKKSELMPLRLLAKGFALSSLDYRLSVDAKFPAAVEDCKAAVRWLRSHASTYNLKADQFIAFGESAGGYFASMLGTTGSTSIFDIGDNQDISSAVQAVVDYYGPTDFLQMDEYAPPGSQQHSHAESFESLFLGVDITKHSDLVKKANPITYISSKTPPFFVAHGTDDRVVAFYQSVLIREALDAAGVSNVFYPVENADHVFKGMSPDQSVALDEATDTFLTKIIQNKV